MLSDIQLSECGIIAIHPQPQKANILHLADYIYIEPIYFCQTGHSTLQNCYLPHLGNSAGNGYKIDYLYCFFGFFFKTCFLFLHFVIKLSVLRVIVMAKDTAPCLCAIFEQQPIFVMIAVLHK